MLSKKFSFSYLDPDDIHQLIAVYALDALPRFRPEAGPLDGFLYRHVRNRLLNVKRDLYKRADAPCKVCHSAAMEGTPGHPDGECEVYRKWRERNAAKASLGRPLDLSGISDEHEPRMMSSSPVENEAEISELLQVIDERLPLGFRADYLRMRSGVKVSKQRREVIEQAVLSILSGVGISADDLGYRPLHRATSKLDPVPSAETAAA